MTVIGPPQSDCRLVPVRGAMPQATFPMSPTRQGAHVCPPRQDRCQPPPIRVARHCGTRNPRPGGRNRDPGSTQWRGAFPRRIVPDPHGWPVNCERQPAYPRISKFGRGLVRETSTADPPGSKHRAGKNAAGERHPAPAPRPADDPVSAHPGEAASEAGATGGTKNCGASRLHYRRGVDCRRPAGLLSGTTRAQRRVRTCAKLKYTLQSPGPSAPSARRGWPAGRRSDSLENPNGKVIAGPQCRSGSRSRARR